MAAICASARSQLFANAARIPTKRARHSNTKSAPFDRLAVDLGANIRRKQRIHLWSGNGRSWRPPPVPGPTGREAMRRIRPGRRAVRERPLLARSGPPERPQPITKESRTSRRSCYRRIRARGRQEICRNIRLEAANCDDLSLPNVLLFTAGAPQSQTNGISHTYRRPYGLLCTVLSFANSELLPYYQTGLRAARFGPPSSI